MLTTKSSKNNLQIDEQNSLFKKLNNDENSYVITMINNNEIYEKSRPLEKIRKICEEHQAHGDDKAIELFSYEIEQKRSSSSDEFSFDMGVRMTDTSNEALKTDDENGMTKRYFISKEKEIILSDISLEQQRQSLVDECEYEIDLGNGWITKSISSYRSDQNQRKTSIISADSIQPISTYKLPFTNTSSKSHENFKIPNVITNSQLPPSKFSFRTITIVSIGAFTILFLTVLIFIVF